MNVKRRLRVRHLTVAAATIAITVTLAAASGAGAGPTARVATVEPWRPAALMSSCDRGAWHDHTFDHAAAGSTVGPPFGVRTSRAYPRNYLITEGRKLYVAWRRAVVDPLDGSEVKVFVGRRLEEDHTRARRSLETIRWAAPHTTAELVSRGYRPVHDGADHWINDHITDSTQGPETPRMYMVRGGRAISAVFVGHAGHLPEFGMGGWHHHGFHTRLKGDVWMQHVWLTTRLRDAFSDGHFLPPAQHDSAERRCREAGQGA